MSTLFKLFYKDMRMMVDEARTIIDGHRKSELLSYYDIANEIGIGMQVVRYFLHGGTPRSKHWKKIRAYAKSIKKLRSEEV